MKTIATAVFLIFVFLPFIVFAKPEIMEVTAKGVGASEREAVEDAFRNAIEESIGLYVSSETQLQNEKLIKDSILTSSNGYIDNYRLSSVSHESGVTKVEITALVKIQDVKSKLVSLNVSILPTEELANIHARLSTRVKRNQDAENILKKELGDFFQPKNILSMLDVKLTSYTIQEDELKQDNTVPYQISFDMSVNLDNYNKQIKNIVKIFENLGGRLNKTLKISFGAERIGPDSAHLAGNDFETYQQKLGSERKASEISDHSDMYFGIVSVEDGNYTLDHYAFPADWKKIYPWKIPEHGHFDDSCSLYDIVWIIKFLDKGGKLVFKKQLSYFDLNELEREPLTILKFSWGNFHVRGEFVPFWSCREETFGPAYYIRYGGTNIGPFITRQLFTKNGSVYKGKSLVKKMSFVYKDRINVDMLYDIKKIEVELAIKENDK